MGAGDDGLAARGLQDDEYSEIGAKPMWELACLRWRCISHPIWQLADRNRRHASSHIFDRAQPLISRRGL